MTTIILQSQNSVWKIPVSFIRPDTGFSNCHPSGPYLPNLSHYSLRDVFSPRRSLGLTVHDLPIGELFLSSFKESIFLTLTSYWLWCIVSSQKTSLFTLAFSPKFNAAKCQSKLAQSVFFERPLDLGSFPCVPQFSSIKLGTS